MGNAGTDHAKATHRAVMIAGRVLLCRMLHFVRLICHMMARHLSRLRLDNAGKCLLCECHLHGHDIGCHDKAWEPAYQEQAETFTHIRLG